MTRSWLALGVLALGVMLIGVDSTVLTVAIPLVSEELAARATEVLWIGDIYSFVLAGLLVTMGSLGDRIGHRKLLLGGATAFGIGSVIAAYAPSAAMLIGARALLGVAGATLAPSTLALIRNLFPDARKRVLAVGIWAAVFSAGTALGPVVGGLLLEHFWWGSVFLVNVPVIVVLLVGGFALLPESRNPTPGPWDLPSVGLSLFGVLGLVYAVKEGVAGGLRVDIVVAGLIGAAAMASFVVRQLQLPVPLIDIRLFRNRSFSGVVAANLLSVMGVSGVVFFLSQFFQLVDGYSPLEAGLAELPAAVAAMVFGVLAGVAVRVWSRRAVLSTGLALVGFALAALTQLTPSTAYAPLGVALFVVGTGLGLVYTVANDVILASVDPERAGAAAAVSETAFELGMALGIAVLGSIVAATYRRVTIPPGTHDVLASHAKESLGAAHQVARTMPADVARDLLVAAQHAFSDGLALAAGIGAVLLLLSALIVGTSREHSVRPTSHSPCAK
jgi:DHA2 family multidrug resistance protein-like MFS transporter